LDRRRRQRRLDGMVHVRSHDLQSRTGPASDLLGELPLRTRDRELLVVEELADPEHDLEILAAINPLTGAILLRREHRELRFPIPQHVRLDANVVADLADLVEQLVGYYFRRLHGDSLLVQ